MLRLLVFVFALVGTSTSCTDETPVVTPAPTVQIPSDGKLGRYGADGQKVSVSGLSSGGFMAVQIHVAFSDTIMGVGVVAGGPYYCAEMNLMKALGQCMTNPSNINVDDLKQTTIGWEANGNVDACSSMYDDMVYLYSGTNDGTVVPGVMEALDEYYGGTNPFVNPANVKKEFSMASGHAFITDNYGNACNTASKKPWISNCGYNQAYEILNHIYGGNLLKPDSSTTAGGQFYEFDQTEFVNQLMGGMTDTGYVYVPTGCSSTNSNCRVHVSLHGCQQGIGFLEDEYARHTGYNEVAELNDVIVIYPQAAASAMNMNGCWDWWGYTGIYYAHSKGYQMKAIKAMIDRVLE